MFLESQKDMDPMQGLVELIIDSLSILTRTLPSIILAVAHVGLKKV